MSVEVKRKTLTNSSNCHLSDRVPTWTSRRTYPEEDTMRRNEGRSRGMVLENSSSYHLRSRTSARKIVKGVVLSGEKWCGELLE